ncbi:MAG: hypothetical protein KatS3mg096_342 [Candidatus Parcubacteria bacterium]|nr:MAG: hypothetical protein KatS3mg096_342 [Candidatus Parcubacteria bacterium]
MNKKILLFTLVLGGLLLSFFFLSFFKSTSAQVCLPLNGYLVWPGTWESGRIPMASTQQYTLSSSPFYVSGNNVGLGTTNPVYTFQVNGDISGTRLCIGSDCRNVWPGGGIAGSGSAGQVAFWTGTSNISGDNALFWDNINKRLGIGTISPQTSLHVAGNITANTFLGTINAANISSGQFGANTGGGNYSFPGNVGIGTTNPTGKLHVYNGSTELMKVVSDVDVVGIVVGPAIGGRHLIINDIAQARWAFATGYYDLSIQNDYGGSWNTRMIITEDGNVGIGTTAPGAKLDVAGNISISGVADLGLDAGDVAGIVPWYRDIFAFKTPTNFEYWDGTSWVAFTPTNPQGMTAWGAGSTIIPAANKDKFRFIIDTGNSVGLRANFLVVRASDCCPGSTYKVEVEGSNDLSTWSGVLTSGSGFMGGAPDAPTVIPFSGGNYRYARITFTKLSGTSTNAFSIYELHLFNNWSPAYANLPIKWDTNGNVGIGTTAPSYKLHVQGGDIYASSYVIGGLGLCIGYDCRTSWPQGLTGSGSSNAIAVWTGSTSLGSSIISQSAGSVNIGGSLSVSGSISGNSVSVSGSVSGNSVSGNTLCIGSDCRTSWPQGLTGGGSSNAIAVWTGSTSLGSSIISQSAGSVNIGGSLSVSGSGIYTSGSVSASGAVSGSMLCIGSDCRTSWPSGSGGLTGSGSSTAIAVWTGSTSLGSSIISQSAGSVNIGGSLSVSGSISGNSVSVSGSVSGNSVSGNTLCIGSDCRTSWPSGSGGLTGSGSSSAIAVWTGSTSLGSSIISQSAGSVNINGSLSVSNSISGGSICIGSSCRSSWPVGCSWQGVSCSNYIYFSNGNARVCIECLNGVVTSFYMEGGSLP